MAEPTYVTMVFKYDIRQFVGNPHDVETPFGKPVAIGIGDAFTERDAIEAELNELKDDLLHAGIERDLST